VESSVELQDLLFAMGMTTAFDSSADFSNMTQTRVCIDKVLHKARIKVDEEGSEAAAVTDIEMRKVTSSGPDGKSIVFHADRPFLFAITEVSSGAIFFLGQYTGK
jgi:serpin B